MKASQARSSNTLPGIITPRRAHRHATPHPKSKTRCIQAASLFNTVKPVCCEIKHVMTCTFVVGFNRFSQQRSISTWITLRKSTASLYRANNPITMEKTRSLLYSSVCGSIRYRSGSTGLRSARAQMMHDLRWTALSLQVASIRKLILRSQGNWVFNSRTKTNTAQNPPKTDSFKPLHSWIRAFVKEQCLLTAVHYKTLLCDFHSEVMIWSCIINKMQKCSCNCLATPRLWVCF